MSYSTSISDGYEFDKAGQYGPEGVVDAFGNALTGATVTVYYSDESTKATLYDGLDKGSTVSNPVSVDGNGNLTFFANPGTYFISVSSGGEVVLTDEVIVPVHPEELADNDEQLATNTAAIANLDSQDFSSDIDALDTRLTTAEGEIDTLQTDVTAAEADIVTNAADIATNTSSISDNATDISTNQTNIATNTSDIATNAADIATNASDIATHSHAASGGFVNEVAATGATEDISFDTEAHDLTMDEDCTFSFTNLPDSGQEGSITVVVRGAFTPTWPASVDWPDATEPTYASPSVYTFMTFDGGTTVFGFLAGSGMG